MKISHAYMLIGANETEKMKYVKEFAEKILFDEGDTVQLLNHPDFTVIEPDGNSIKIEQIRNMIQKVYEKPITSKRKVYIINNAEKMTKEAGNCLLKTLEEPPEYVTIILNVFSESMVLNTIRSRCQKIVFKSDSNGKEFDSELYKNLDNIFKSEISLLDFLEECKILYNKDEIYDILEYINIVFMEKLKQNMNNNNTSRYINCIKLVEQTKNKLKYNANFDMSVDNLLFNLYKLNNR